MPRLWAAVAFAMAAAFAQSADAQFLHDADTEALAKATIEKYRSADLNGAFAAARENLWLVREFSMKSVIANADYQSLIGIRSVVDPGGSLFNPDVAVFESPTAVFDGSCDEIDRPLHHLLRCEFGFADSRQLVGVLRKMKLRLDELDQSSARARNPAGPKFLEAAPESAEAQVLRLPVLNVEVARMAAGPQAQPDCSAEGLLYEDVEEPSLEQRFNAAVDCAHRKTTTIAEQKKAHELDRRRYAIIDLGLTRVANGRYDPSNLPAIGTEPTKEGEVSKAAAEAAAARRLTSVLAAASLRRAAVNALDTIRTLANVCAADALDAYFDAMVTASDEELKNESFRKLIVALFGPQEKENVENCEAILACEIVPGGNPFKDDPFRTKWKTVFGQWKTSPVDEFFDRMERAIKAINAARLGSVITAEAPRKTPKDIAIWLKKAAGTLDAELTRIATTASDIGVSLAAVEAQLEAVKFILDAGAAGSAPELDPAKACAALEGDAKTACEARLSSLSPRIKAAAAIAGSAPGLLLAMQTLIDETAEPPPLQLVIAKEQLSVRAAALGKRLALLDAERMAWANLARNYESLADASSDLLNSLGPLCALFEKGRPPASESCTPVALSERYKATSGEFLDPNQRRAVLNAGGRFANLVWLTNYARGKAFNDLLHLGYENLLLIDEETTGLAAAAIGATLSEIDFRAKRGIKSESLADFTARLINLGLLSAIAIGGD